MIKLYKNYKGFDFVKLGNLESNRRTYQKGEIVPIRKNLEICTNTYIAYNLYYVVK